MATLRTRTQIARRFGENVRHARLAQSLSQEALALAAGIDRAYLGKIERGENVPTIDILARLAHALRVASDVLLAGIIA